MDAKNHNRFIRLHAWYVTPNGQRQFAVVDKAGKMMDSGQRGGSLLIYRTTDVSLLEVLSPNPIHYEIDKFWQLVDDGKLVEFIPGKTDLAQLQADHDAAQQQTTLFPQQAA